MDGYIGEVRFFGGSWAPKNWAFCQGQTLQTGQYQALFSIIGSIYGGDGISTFKLPDIRGRVAIGTGTGPALTRRPLGQWGGMETNQLTVSSMPTHMHNVHSQLSASASMLASSSEDGVNNTGTENYIGTGGTMPEIYKESLENPVNMPTQPVQITGNINIAETGGNLPHNNIQPFQALNYIICLKGIYPQRPN